MYQQFLGFFFIRILIKQHQHWTNTKLEKEIDEVLDICLAIRQLKSEHNLTKKHQPKGKRNIILVLIVNLIKFHI